MSKLTALRGKDPKEVARLLSVVSSSLLPSPGIDDLVHQHEANQEFVKAVLNEIRGRLRVPENDQSARTHSRIYAFLSEEISRVTLTNQALSNVRTRLGNKGELHPSQYEVKFSKDILQFLEDIGHRRNHIIEAVTFPDKVTHLKAKFLPSEKDPRITMSVKLIETKHVEDRFTLLVLSHRVGHIQNIVMAYRVYHSDVDLNSENEPVEVSRLFVYEYGFSFLLGGQASRFMLNEAITVKEPLDNIDAMIKSVKVIDSIEKSHEAGIFFGAPSHLMSTTGEQIHEIIIGFVININKYLASLRRHNVTFAPEVSRWLDGL